MGLIDSDKRSLRFAIIASTTGGLSVATVTAMISGILRSELLTTPVPLWSLLVAAGATLASSFMLPLLNHRHPPSKRVFLVIPAFVQKHWVAELLQNIHHSLNLRGYDLVLKIPDRDYAAIAQVHHLRQIIRQRTEYVGGFIIPNEVERIRPDLVKFCNEASMPVVFVDVEPFRSEHDYPHRSAFAGYSASEIGELAADWVVAYLHHSKEQRPTVLIVGGDAQNLRQERFKDVISHRIKGVRIIDDKGEFVRSRAQDVVQKHLEQIYASGQQLHVIFCTNDEMALGAVDALYSLDPAKAHLTAVIGVDGTPQARALIDTRKSPLRATVVQESYELAEHATDLLVRLLGDDNVAAQTLLKARVYSRD